MAISYRPLPAVRIYSGVLFSPPRYLVLFTFLIRGQIGSAQPGSFFAGVYLAYAYIRTKQLWLSIGLHIGWNFFEGVVFGFPVSGLATYTLSRINVHGPELWTGGAFGPEAGLIILPSLIVGGILIYLYTRKRVR